MPAPCLSSMPAASAQISKALRATSRPAATATAAVLTTYSAAAESAAPASCAAMPAPSQGDVVTPWTITAAIAGAAARRRYARRRGVTRVSLYAEHAAEGGRAAGSARVNVRAEDLDVQAVVQRGADLQGGVERAQRCGAGAGRPQQQHSEGKRRRHEYSLHLSHP